MQIPTPKPINKLLGRIPKAKQVITRKRKKRQKKEKNNGKNPKWRSVTGRNEEEKNSEKNSHCEKSTLPQK